MKFFLDSHIIVETSAAKLCGNIWGCIGFDRDRSNADKQAVVPKATLKKWELKINAKTNKTAVAGTPALLAA